MLPRPAKVALDRRLAIVLEQLGFLLTFLGNFCHSVVGALAVVPAPGVYVWDSLLKTSILTCLELSVHDGTEPVAVFVRILLIADLR